MAFNKEVLSVSINDEGNLFVASTESGIRIYNMEPLVSKLHVDSSKVGSVALCKLLHRTNLITFVGGGMRPKFSENSVLVWNAEHDEIALDFTFSSKVLNLVTRRDRIFVAERNKIHCFTFPENPTKLFTIETGDNPTGIFEVTPLTNATELQLLAYPGHRMGSVQLIDLSTMEPEANGASVSHSPTSVSAHESEIACIALNRSGNLLATASRKGTLIRLYRTVDASALTSGRTSTNAYIPLSPEKVGQFRRGLDTATLYCLVFSPDSEYLLASSDKGTVHIFALNQLDRKSSTSISSKLVTLVDVYSISKFALPAECACVCAFGPDRRSVYAVCVDGSFHKYLLNKDGTCKRDNFDNYLEVHEEADYIFQKDER